MNYLQECHKMALLFCIFASRKQTNKKTIMSIKSVKVTMSTVGVNAVGAPRKVMYMPIAKIDYMEKGHRSQRVLLDNEMVPDKKHFKGWIIGLSFFAGCTKDSYQIYDENGNRTGTANIEKVGTPIQVNEDDFVCLKGRIASWINRNGECEDSRELTDEEYRTVTE